MPLLYFLPWSFLLGSSGLADLVVSYRLLRLAFVLVVAVLAGTGVAVADNRDVPPLPQDWTANEDRAHPLVGAIWSRAAAGLISAQDYGTALAKSRFVLLGETHDNPDHHRLQAWAIRTIAKLRGARLVEGAPQADTVALEMLSSDQQPALDRFYGRNAKVPRQRGSADFGRMLKWETLGWPDYAIYEPIIAAALDAQLVVVPANPGREETRKVGREGAAALPADEVARLALAEPLDAAVQAALDTEIGESHCGMLPAKSIPAMSLVQRLRDARMADALLAAGAYKGAILIAGNGHVRRDRGVPWYMVERGVGPGEITSVAHVEVFADKANASDYIDASGERVDFIVFTPRQARADPCEEMRRQMHEMRLRREASPGGASSGGEARGGAAAAPSPAAAPAPVPK